MTSNHSTFQASSGATKMDDAPAIVSGSVAKCSYRDLSQETEKSGQALDESFPTKLHFMLADLERDGHDFIVSWHVHGRCFSVRRQPLFVKHVMPCYFRQSKFPSFQRQLNLYGFRRITSGPDKGSYYHECFLRGKPFLASRIQRQRIKGTGSRKPAVPEQEPCFHEMPFLPPSDMAKYKAAAPANDAVAPTATSVGRLADTHLQLQQSLLGLPPPPRLESVLGVPSSADVLSMLCRNRSPSAALSQPLSVTGLASASPLTAVMATRLSAAKLAAARAVANPPARRTSLAVPDVSSSLFSPPRLAARPSAAAALAEFDRALAMGGAGGGNSVVRQLINRSIANRPNASSLFTQTNAFFGGY
ncbi:Heat stress transcription factor [Seminavis robusta]|uniref:Heat stress transcription factor n=1 Tax=Seminavis robusta TaxID=568900 RepID=A0A9N8DR95_9STRA|nr:Heat stress transcription factor [Seminavis robusta]|eukprot:Sro299_g111240.1 Heat stress transcription factor (361) ;mRNA; f:2781-4036